MRREKSTKTGATLHLPVHPVLQALLERWWEEGWARYMGRKPEPNDFVFPREDGKQRLVSGSWKHFRFDLETLGLPIQRQYESRSTFRNLALSAGASEFHLNLITHPKPKRASDYYTRLEMQWPGMCEAVLAIDPAAWESASEGGAEPPSPEVTFEVTDRVTVKGTTDEKTPTTLRIVGVTHEREKGFESGFSRVISRRYETRESDGKSPTEPSDASGRVATSLQGSDGTSSPSPLPSPSPDLFITAGAVVAEWAARSREARTRIDEILRRAVDQATALREGAP